MTEYRIDTGMIEGFRISLREKEKSPATIRKYIREIEFLEEFLHGREITKGDLLEYSEYLQEGNRPQTVNGKLAAVNAFLDFIGMPAERLKYQRVQRKIFAEEARELTQEEYKRLLEVTSEEMDDQIYIVQNPEGKL